MGSNYKFFTFLFIASLLVVFNANAYDSLRVEKKKGQKVVIHEVEKGETLYSLSRRYKSEVKQIIEFNDLENNALSLGQLLVVPIGKDKDRNSRDTSSGPTSLNIDPETEAVPMMMEEAVSSDIEHEVQPKETLYSLSKAYNVTIDQIKEWNGMDGNSLSVGQIILIKDSTKVEKPIEAVPSVVKSSKPGFNEYRVQSGDLIETIARKYKVRPDSILIWNELPNSYLAIGQLLLIKGEVDFLGQTIAPKVVTTNYSQKTKMVDQSGFSKVLEEGIAKPIEGSIDTDKYLAMHRTLKVGTMIEVRNLMNNKKIFVRIVGKLPETGLNEKTLVRLTPICFKKLGVIDNTARVEISYYED